MSRFSGDTGLVAKREEVRRMTRYSSITAFGIVALLCTAATAQDAPPPAPSGPADLCKELLAFVKPPEAPAAAAPAPAPAPQQATAVSAPANKDASQPSSVAGETQQKSGLSGPVPSTGPSSNASTFNQTYTKANSEAKGAAPPGTPKPAPKPDEAMIAKVETAAAGNDTAGCRAAAQVMRKAGVGLPPPLIALSALDVKFFAKP